MAHLSRRSLLRSSAAAAAGALLGSSHSPAAAARLRPIALHPSNPHYFELRGKPAVLITSGEHYGAVLNPDFDFMPYLDELRAHRLNLTRVFSGTYVEQPGAFKIQSNDLAPARERFLCPWARSGEAGYAGGGAKFDLTKWDESYFRRLKALLREAGKREVVVEYVLFCPCYDDGQWNLSPMNAANNVNGVGAVPRIEHLTLKHPQLVAMQEAFVRKVVRELREFDNLYFEICNEPYFGGVTLEWQARIAAVIQEAEADLPARSRHLIAQNIANGSAEIKNPNPAVSLFNFHYASPPNAVRVNYGLNRPIAFDETGFRGVADLPYRTEAWEFILAGGAVYSNLDYSYTVASPNGSAKVEDPTPGGGGPALRKQLSILKSFIEKLPFVTMAPDAEVVQGGVPSGAAAHALSAPGKAYGIYLRGGTQAELALRLPAGRYRIEWVNPRTGAIDRSEALEARGETTPVRSPNYVEDIALRIVRR